MLQPVRLGNGFWVGKAGSLWSRPPGQKRGFDEEAPGPLTLEQVITHTGGARFEFYNAYELEFLAKAQVNELRLDKPCN